MQTVRFSTCQNSPKLDSSKEILKKSKKTFEILAIYITILHFRFDVEENLQRLVFKGKLMNNSNTLFDYGVNLNDVIQLWRKEPLADADETAAQDKDQDKSAADVKEAINVVEDADSDFFQLGDIVDILDTEEGEYAGGWFEGAVVRITREEGDSLVAGSDGLTYYVKYEE